jgi:hypothetical protein
VIFVGDSISFMAALSGVAGVSPPTGTVEFKNGAAVLCASASLTSGSASCGPFTNLLAGTHTITASYSGDVNYNSVSASITVTVNKHSSSASGLDYESAADTWEAFNFNTNNNKLSKTTDYKLRTQITDNDSPAHTTPVPTGQVEIWLVNNDGVAQTGVTDYVISQVTDQGAVSYDAAAKRYKVSLNNSGNAIFNLNFPSGINNVTLRYRYLGDDAFESSPLNTDNPNYKVSTTFSVN